MVREGRADTASIDCVSYALIERYRPADLQGIRILLETPRVPAPPFVTSIHAPDDRMAKIREALTEILEDPSLHLVREKLLLRGAQQVPLGAYAPIVEMRDRAERNGVLQLGPPPINTRSE